MPQHAFETLQGERTDDEVYKLYGLPRGGNFRKKSEYTELTATWLKVEGVAFSAPAFSFGEHQTYIMVEQPHEGGGANITFDSVAVE